MSDVQEQAEQPVIGQSMDDFMGEQFDALEAEEIEEQVSADVEESVETKQITSKQRLLRLRMP